jgi:hypothetical protein
LGNQKFFLGGEEKKNKRRLFLNS